LDCGFDAMFSTACCSCSEKLITETVTVTSSGREPAPGMSDGAIDAMLKKTAPLDKVIATLNKSQPLSVIVFGATGDWQRRNCSQLSTNCCSCSTSHHT